MTHLLLTLQILMFCQQEHKTTVEISDCTEEVIECYYDGETMDFCEKFHLELVEEAKNAK